MKVEGWMFAGIAIFLGGAAAVYWYLSKDPTGATALALCAGLAFLIGYYLLFTTRRLVGPRPEDREDGEIADAAGEIGHFSPHSWWPLITAAAAAVAMIGLIFEPWLLVLGLAGCLFGGAGFLFEYAGDKHAPHAH